MISAGVFFGGIRVGGSSMERVSACMGCKVVGFVGFRGLVESGI